MKEFQNLIYLDVPKSGSTFVTKLLRRHLGEPMLRSNNHGVLRGYQKKCDKYKLITIRQGHSSKAIKVLNFHVKGDSS